METTFSMQVIRILNSSMGWPFQDPKSIEFAA